MTTSLEARAFAEIAHAGQRRKYTGLPYVTHPAAKALDRRHTRQASPQAKTIKLADLIDNSRSIVQYDPDFAKVYMAEKTALLGVLTEGDPTLWTKAREIVADYHVENV